MHRIVLLAAIVMAWTPALSSSKFQEFVDRVNAATYPERPAIVDSFLAAIPSGPFIEDSTATFLYRGTATSVTVPGDANGWNTAGYPMTKLSTTDLWYFSQSFEMDARLDYKFILNGSTWILDPRNPHTVTGGFGPNSELAMPGYIQPWEIQYRASIPHGKVVARSIHSGIRGVNYNLQVYLPPGYDESTASYPTVYFQDGGEYVSLGSSVNVLNNLIDSMLIRPVIGVFVTPIDRNVEYAGSLRFDYTNFFVNELVPFIDTAYRTLASPEYRAVIGDSYGGNISALISYNYTSVFGNCGLHSAAFQPYNYEVYNLIMNGRVKSDSLRFAAVWGTYEQPIPQVMHAFRDTLLGHGYFLPTMERHEGHSWGLWRATTSFLVEQFFPVVSGVVGRPALPSGFRLLPNFPNPFNPATEIRYTLGTRANVELVVVDLLGRRVETLAEGVVEPGEHSARWNASSRPSGVYYCRLRVSAVDGMRVLGTDVRKMLLVR